MTKITTKDPRDISVINKALEFNSRLLIGDRNQEKIKQFKEFLENKILTVNILSANEQTQSVNSLTPGICDMYTNGQSHITMRGFKDSQYENYQFIVHEFIHEYWHAFVNAANYIHGENEYKNEVKNPDGTTSKKFNICGEIRKQNLNTGEIKDYGIMFTETTADILTTLSLMAFEPMFPRKGANIDTVFQKHFDEWGDASTGYSIFTTLTRLLIAAFQNDASISYQSLVENGYSIISTETKTKNNHIRYLNDYLYGIVYDPLHIEHIYDKFLGQNQFEKLCTTIDEVFTEYLNTGVFTNKMRLQIKWFTTTVADFLNKKLMFELRNGIISIEDKNRIVSNFNKIWNTIASEYKYIVTQADLDGINKRAYEPAILHLAPRKK